MLFLSLILPRYPHLLLCFSRECLVVTHRDSHAGHVWCMITSCGSHPSAKREEEGRLGRWPKDHLTQKFDCKQLPDFRTRFDHKDPISFFLPGFFLFSIRDSGQANVFILLSFSLSLNHLNILKGERKIDVT